jgi:hypothetical protein
MYVNKAYICRSPRMMDALHTPSLGDPQHLDLQLGRDLDGAGVDFMKPVWSKFTDKPYFGQI